MTWDWAGLALLKNWVRPATDFVPLRTAREEYHAWHSDSEKEASIADINEQSDIKADYRLSAPDPARQRHKSRWVVWAVLLLAVAIVFALVFYHHEEAIKAAAAAATAARAKTGIAITTVTAQKGDIGVYLEAIGTVTPVFTDSITSQVNGLVVSVHFKEGQLVQKGDPLIDIDPRPYNATLCKHKARSSVTRTCSPRLRWTSNATKMRGTGKQSQSNSSMTSRSSSSRTRAS